MREENLVCLPYLCHEFHKKIQSLWKTKNSSAMSLVKVGLNKFAQINCIYKLAYIVYWTYRLNHLVYTESSFILPLVSFMSEQSIGHDLALLRCRYSYCRRDVIKAAAAKIVYDTVSQRLVLIDVWLYFLCSICRSVNNLSSQVLLFQP